MSKSSYREWIFPIADYFDCLTKNEKNFEQTVPAISSIVSTIICAAKHLSLQAASHLNGLLPNVLAILIGFTISTIAIIVSASNDPQKVINKEISSTISGREITFKRWFLVNLVYYTIYEIFSLLFTFLMPLVQKVIPYIAVTYVAIFVYAYSMMRILFGIIKTTTKLYFVFYKDA